MAAEQIEMKSDADFGWLAFQYVSGELSGAELDAFEKLLATNDRVCAAVAEAVVLAGAVRVIESEAAPRPAILVQRSSPASSLAGSAFLKFSRRVLVACSVACGVLFVGWLSVRTPHEEGLSADSAATVASLWVAGADEVAGDEAILPEVAAVKLVEEDPVPGWLMAAVTEQQQAMEDEEIIND